MDLLFCGQTKALLYLPLRADLLFGLLIRGTLLCTLDSNYLIAAAAEWSFYSPAIRRQFNGRRWRWWWWSVICCSSSCLLLLDNIKHGELGSRAAFFLWALGSSSTNETHKPQIGRNLFICRMIIVCGYKLRGITNPFSSVAINWK